MGAGGILMHSGSPKLHPFSGDLGLIGTFQVPGAAVLWSAGDGENSGRARGSAGHRIRNAAIFGGEGKKGGSGGGSGRRRKGSGRESGCSALAVPPEHAVAEAISRGATDVVQDPPGAGRKASGAYPRRVGAPQGVGSGQLWRLRRIIAWFGFVHHFRKPSPSDNVEGKP